MNNWKCLECGKKLPFGRTIPFCCDRICQYNYAIKLLRKYPQNKTVKEYCCLLAWDMKISQETIRHNIIEPMIAHEILIVSGQDSKGNNLYHVNNLSDNIGNKLEDKIKE